MEQAPKRTVYGTPGNGKAAKDRAAKGRTCDHPGCNTVLSTYNAATTCWMHTVPGRRTPLAKA
jgi:hypothetical protein